MNKNACLKGRGQGLPRPSKKASDTNLTPNLKKDGKLLNFFRLDIFGYVGI